MLDQTNITISQATEKEFSEIVNYIADFELDNRALLSEQFLVARFDDEIVGFGRLRMYDDCQELCSLGVIESERLKGIGKELSKALIKQASKPLYLVCIIPEFFEPLGFSVIATFPEELQNKLDYCTGELVVPETYVVMKKG